MPESNSNICILLSLFRLYRLLVLCKGSCFCGCISFDSYIKPQLFGKRQSSCLVVYLLIPTSNHNLQYNTQKTSTVVYLLIPTSNHNTQRWYVFCTNVVYLLIPTSNHNCYTVVAFVNWLYIFWFLHQTTTIAYRTSYNIRLYIFWFLHQTTTTALNSHIKAPLYIFWFLHQTTTQLSLHLCGVGCISFDSYIKPQPVSHERCKQGGCISFDSYIKPQLVSSVCWRFSCCISFDSYIKPQLLSPLILIYKVVYLLIPTSNHNPPAALAACGALYIFWFLHQTTTDLYTVSKLLGCISFDSYIKPQPFSVWFLSDWVVYLFIAVR